ncbi:MAG: PTS sugar transporter subunit IIA [Candidatus Cloacimonadaceae bacterium]
MHLVSLLNPKLIHFEDRQLSKEQILKAMIEKICSSFKLKNRCEQIYEMVLQREKEAPTVYPTGIAIPHVRVDDLDDTIIAICVPKQPIQNGGAEIKIYILIITDKNVSSLYLNVVAAFMRISKDTDFFHRLLAAGDPNTFISLIKDAGIVVKDEVTVSDIMTPVPHVINENESIRALAEMMKENGLYYVPVVNDNGDWVGDVNILHYLEVSLPDYMRMLNNVNFLRNFEPFEHLYKKEDSVLIKHVMSKPERLLKPEFSIIEAVFEMVRQKKQTFSVIQDKKVVGIVTAMDIYKKVVRA